MTTSWFILHGCIGVFWFFIGKVAASSAFLEDPKVSVQDKRQEMSSGKWWLRTLASAPLLPLFMGWMQTPLSVDSDGIVNEGYEIDAEYHWPVWLWYAFCAFLGGLVRVTSYQKEAARQEVELGDEGDQGRRSDFDNPLPETIQTGKEPSPSEVDGASNREDDDERWNPECIRSSGPCRHSPASKPLCESDEIVTWKDPDLQELEREIERLTTELAELEVEQAELAHQIARFHAEHHRALGERLKRVLELRLKLKEWIAKRDPKRVEEVNKARRDYEGFRDQQAATEAKAARTDWQLSKDEQRELKSLFRAASKRCHPDVVSEEHADAAAAMFRELNEAYECGDLAAVRRYATQAESGIFETDCGGAGRKEALGARLESLREALRKAAESVSKLRSSATYQVMMANETWESYFMDQRKKLDAEIERLNERLIDEDIEARYGRGSRE